MAKHTVITQLPGAAGCLDTIRRMGDKAEARRTAQAAGVTLPCELLQQPWLQRADFNTGTLETWLGERLNGGAA
ncbi:hypothetical protein [Pseudomonas fragi]|uniref:hypothetical protein n=1 Tax=Pseudomonas fragi TaxID=296 RepID=UPI001F3FDD76|nr:hypothetical protein [Pseudomonas fragi]MCF6761891.1 hypothetical protein [Pseudomonas fragi]MCK6252961.1 hypothetical protein [Pseudomonas fragi]